MVRTSRKSKAKSAPAASFKRMRRVYLREWREHHNMTQAQLIARIACKSTIKSREQLSKIENGVHPYNEKLLVALAEIYNCDPADLLTRHPKRDPEGIWSIVDSLRAPQLRQAAAMLAAWRDAAERNPG